MAKLPAAKVVYLKTSTAEFLSLARISPYYKVLYYCKFTRGFRPSTSVGLVKCGLEVILLRVLWLITVTE